MARGLRGKTKKESMNGRENKQYEKGKQEGEKRQND